MIKFDFEKVLFLSSYNKQFFSLQQEEKELKKILKLLLLLLLAPIYVIVSVIVYALYLCETLLTIPSKLVNPNRVANTPFDKTNPVPFNASYIILYIFVMPFDLFSILASWFIALLSLVLDLIGNIVCLGKRNFSAFDLCFDTNCKKSEVSTKHFWLFILGVAMFAGIYFLGSYLATEIATTEEVLEMGYESVKEKVFDAELHDTIYYIFLALTYFVPTIILTLIYSKEK